MKHCFFNYKIDLIKLIDKIISNFFRLQLMIKSIKAIESSINLNVALIFINSIEKNAYNIIKIYLKNIKNFILKYIKKRYKIVKQKIKIKIIFHKTVNKAKSLSKKQKNAFIANEKNI